MPDSRSHRSAGPQDRVLFGPDALSRLREAVEHLCWLQSRGYGETSALKLVGDRFELTARQRMAINRAACSDAALEDRTARRVAAARLRSGSLGIDGFNVLTTVEVALGGGVVLIARDECVRDVASLHGTWRRVEETRPALTAIGEFLAPLEVAECAWFVDAPVSNSGRLRGLIEELATERGWRWRVEVVRDADAAVIDCGMVAVSADRRVLDGCRAWFNLARELIDDRVPDAWCADLRTS